MQAKEVHISIPKTARYFALGNDRNPENIWFVLHGYGHLAEYFIRKFSGLDLERDLVIAPEGLHRYYTQGTSGRVGASWMTKEDRLNDIKDYIAFLDLVALEVTTRIPAKRTIVLGFSQGAATASRWIAYGQTQPHHFVLWASVFPPDMNFEVDRDRFNASDTWLVYGDNDEYIPLDTFQNHVTAMENKGVSFRIIKYSGAHNIYPETLLQLRSSMIFD